jgi:small subunit ribosomal protein S9
VAEATKKKQYYWGTGRRKTSVARVRIAEGSGKITINGDRSLGQFFTEEKDRRAVLGPLELIEMQNRLDVAVNVEGGGFTGQGGAISQGLARALKDMFSGMPGSAQPAPQQPSADGEVPPPPAEDNSPFGMIKRLRDSGYLTRDGRMKERKKYGKKGARRSFQFSKR